MTNDVFRMRMESQCQEIEQYRQSVLRDGDRNLTLEEAALEWIEQFAESFDGNLDSFV
ncbi:MAG: hypothetical protein ACI9JM_000190 [Halioglobus sp.]|jgi:hypothetical protein